VSAIVDSIIRRIAGSCGGALGAAYRASEIRRASGELRGSRLRADGEAQDAFCALGTTIRKAGSKDAFYTSIMISSRTSPIGRAGAGHRRSALFLRSEQIRIAVIFIWRPRAIWNLRKEQHFPRVDIFRPSVPTGLARGEPCRRADRVGGASNRKPLLVGWLRQYRPIEAKTVAAAMVAAAQDSGAGTRMFVYDQFSSGGSAGLLIEMQAFVDGVKGQFQTVGDTEFVEDVVEVVLHRLLADEHLLGHFLVLVALGDEATISRSRWEADCAPAALGPGPGTPAGRGRGSRGRLGI